MTPEEKEKINDIIVWLQYMYTVIYSATPTYDELLEFAHDVLTDGRKVKTESSILSFNSSGTPESSYKSF
mgnify:CR=1 FL=1